jgi:hypothetical protein
MRKEVAMGDRKIKVPTHAIEQITPELKAALNQAKNKLKGRSIRVLNIKYRL